MNAEQKQRAVEFINDWKSDDGWVCAGNQMADLLQELVDAPEAEPVARVTGYYAGYLSIATVDGRVLPTGTALYTAPPAPSAPDGWRDVLEAVLREMPGRKDNNGNAPGHGHRIPGIWDSDNGPLAGKPCAWCLAWNTAKKMLAATPTPPEPPADVVRDAERLDWLAESGASVAKCKVGHVTRFRLQWVSSDECQDDWFSSVRDAIDAAIAEVKGSK